MPFDHLLRPELGELQAYAPHPGDFPIRLDANEAPPRLSAAARERLAAVGGELAWERYPDARHAALRALLAQQLGLTPEELVFGCGSDELIALLLTALARPRPSDDVPTVLTTTPTFVMYKASARARGWRVLEVPLDRDWALSVDSMERALGMTRPNLIFVATPNNPTGTVASEQALRRLSALAPDAVLVIDEAYLAYAQDDWLRLYRELPNVALLRTLSKVGFASLRVGWLIARPELARELEKVRLPYNLPTHSQQVAQLVLTELQGEVDAMVQEVKAERARLQGALAEVPGLSVTPSQANFLWIRTERPAVELFEGLARRGVLVRSFHLRGGRLAHQLRVTVGTPEQNDALLVGLRALA